jgi:Bacterial Ig-like domain
LSPITGTGSVNGAVVTLTNTTTGINVGSAIVTGGIWTVTPTIAMPTGSNTVCINGATCRTFTVTASGGVSTGNILNFSQFCVGSALTFPAATTGNNLVAESPYHGYGTLGSAPRYKLFYMKIATGGILNISQSNSAGVDVDGALWGPFNNIPDFLRDGTTNVTANKYPAPLASDYATSATFNFTNVNVLSNKYYVLAIANFGGTATNISFNSGSGTTAVADCSINTPGLDVTYPSPAVKTLENGYTGSYTTTLNRPPSGNVTLGTANSANQVTTSPSTLTFTPTNWYVPQTVTATAIDDTATDGVQNDTIVNSVSSTDPNYNTLTENVPAIAYDNDITPGGVVSGLVLWNRADMNVSTSGSNVTGWVDQTGGNTFSVTGTPQYIGSGLNYNPLVRFNGTSRFNGDTSISNQTEAFAVGKIVNPTSVLASGALIGTTTVGTHQYQFHTESGQLYSVGNTNVAYSSTNAFGSSVGPVIFNSDNSETPAANQKIKINGLGYTNNAGGDIAVYSGIPTLGSRGTENILANSELAEAIIYNTSKSTSNERQRIQSYLATKYGITLDQSTAQNYLATDSTVYWNGTTNIAYKHNITAIGRDDATALNQKQSKSINTAGLVTVGRGSIVASNASNTNTFASNKSYFAFGDDNGTLTWSSTGAPTNLQILGRKFKAQTTNFSESVKIEVPDDSSTLSTKLPSELNNKVYLLVDNDGNGNFQDGTIQTIAMTLVGTTWDPEVTIPNGAVFTFATPTIPTTMTAPDMTAATDTGTSNADNITSDNTPDFTGACTNGDTIKLYVNNVAILPTATCSGGTYTITPASVIADGAHTITSTATNTFGLESAQSPALNVTVNATVPTTPTIPEMTAGTDTGSSNLDNITNDTTPDITGTCTNGNIVTLFVDGTAILPTQVCAGGIYTITPSTAISSGNHNITSTQTSSAGMVSAQSPALAITIDTTAPTAPSVAPDMTTGTDLGSSSTDNITNDNTPDFTGTCTPGDTIVLYVNGLANGSQVCPVEGTYIITASPAITNGLHNITITTTDIAGNTSGASPILAVVIDTVIPTNPSMPDMTSGTDTGLSSTDNITNDTTPDFTGICINGEVVTLYLGGNANGSIVCASGT